MDLNGQLQQIVFRCKGGDRDAFEELFGLYQPRLKYYVRRLDGSDGADDLLQDIWITVFKKIGKLKEPKAFNVWLYRIARNRVFTGFRRKERFLSLPEENELPVSNSDESAFSADDAEKLHAALGKLKTHHKEVLTLSFIEQMPHQSIADVVGCKIGTVRSRIYYAKRSLRKEMERNNG